MRSGLQQILKVRSIPFSQLLHLFNEDVKLTTSVSYCPTYSLKVTQVTVGCVKYIADLGLVRVFLICSGNTTLFSILSVLPP